MKTQLVLLINLLVLGTSLIAQDGLKARRIYSENVKVYMIAISSSDVRINLFEACKNPAAITHIKKLQRHTSTKLKRLIKPLDIEHQYKLYNLARYDTLIRRLSQANASSDWDLEDILSQYPEEISCDGDYFFKKHHKLLKEISDLNNDFNTRFREYFKNYPQTTRNVFTQLLNSPETMQLLTSDSRFTAAIGKAYTDEPECLIELFDELNWEIPQQLANDFEKWKGIIAADTATQTELLCLLEEFAKENGYSRVELEKANPVYVDRYPYIPFAYWTGYPWWYKHSAWYPYPYWYHLGFYRWHNKVIWTGTPSCYFLRWYFKDQRHHYRYPHISVILNSFSYSVWFSLRGSLKKFKEPNSNIGVVQEYSLSSIIN